MSNFQSLKIVNRGGEKQIQKYYKDRIIKS